MPARERPVPATMEGDDPDADLLVRLRAGEEHAFVSLVARYQATLVRLARGYVGSAAVAEEVAQETWVAVLRGIDGFEGRSSFRTWLLRILVNRARSTGEREHRTVPAAHSEPSVDPARFDRGGAWTQPPRPWQEESEERLDARALRDPLRRALDGLPTRQREVVMLRDVNGLSSAEVCEALDISNANERVLLHRARSRLRAALEAEVGLP